MEKEVLVSGNHGRQVRSALVVEDVDRLAAFLRIDQLVAYSQRRRGALSETGHIICKSKDLPTASRLRSEETSLKAHRLNSIHHRVSRHADMVPFLSRSHHPLCDHAVHVRAPYALQVRIAHLDKQAYKHRSRQ